MNVTQIAQFLKKKQFSFLSQEPIIRLIGTSAYNTTFSIDEKYVFRANTHQDDVGGHGLRSEHEILKLLPLGMAPEPLILDDSCKEFPVPYRIESLAKGEVVSLYTKEILSLLAKHLAKKHSFTFEKSGPYPGTKKTYSIGETLKPFMDAMKDAEEFHEFIQKANEYIIFYDSKLSLKQFSLVHYDLNSDNMLFDGHKLTLIDWEFAEIGDPAVDICTLFWFSYLFGYTPKISDEDKDFFLQEYIAAGGSADIRDRIKIQEPLIVLLQSLWFAAQIKNNDRIPVHILTSERLEIYKQGLQLGLKYLYEHNFVLS